jgi:NADH-quinone oxidoreductase subunit N
MFSLTGIPLTAGFWGKFLVFAGAAVGGYLWLAVAGVLGSVVSFGYYGAAIRSAYIDEAPAQEGGASAEEPPATRSRLATATVGVLALLIVVVGVAPLVSGLTPVFNALLR